MFSKENAINFEETIVTHFFLKQTNTSLFLYYFKFNFEILSQYLKKLWRFIVDDCERVEVLVSKTVDRNQHHYIYL
jgi:hypothetical protein